MSFQTLHLTKGDISQIFNIQEDHFNDFKAKGLNGKQFSKAVSAFANASGGEIYVGIREETASKVKHWEGFGCPEDANSFIQILEELSTVEKYYDAEFLLHPELKTYL